MSAFQLLWRHRILLRQTTANDIRARYAGSPLGLGWLVCYPILFLGAYTLVYRYIAKVRPAGFDSPYEYVALVFCGLIPFLGFTEALALGVSSVTSNANLIKNTLFPIELIPVKAVLTAQCTQVVGTALLLVVLAAMQKLTAWALLLPLIWVLQILMSLGVLWILASLNVFLRDLQNIVALLTLILMMISPIAWTLDQVPEGFRPLLGVNPLYYLIVSYQDALMVGRFPRAGVFWVLLALGPGLFLAGHWFFSRMKRVFADNV